MGQRRGGRKNLAASGFQCLPENQVAPLTLNPEDVPSLHYSIAAAESKKSGVSV